MVNRNVKWLTYTVLVGLIPVLARFLIWAVTDNQHISLLNATDFIIFGLILQISNINEIEHFHNGHQSWKTFQNGSSIIFIVMYAVLFACQLLGQSIPGLINDVYMLIFAISLSVVSLMLSGSVYYRLSKLVP